MSDIKFDDELQELRFDCGYDGYGEFDPEAYEEGEEQMEWIRARAFRQQNGNGDSVDALIAYKDALEESYGRLLGQFKKTTDYTAGVTFTPFVKDGMVGYECFEDEAGSVRYVYFNPTADSDDGQANIFVYEGERCDPAFDGTVVYINVF